MTKHWTIDGVEYREQLYSHHLGWGKDTMEFEYVNDVGQHVLISFPIGVEYVSIKHLESTLSSEEAIFCLVQEAKCNVPTYPFFIRSDTPLIHQVINEPYSYRGERSFLQYTMVTCDFWIDVVSSVPPVIRMQKQRQGDGVKTRGRFFCPDKRSRDTLFRGGQESLRKSPCKN